MTNKTIMVVETISIVAIVLGVVWVATLFQKPAQFGSVSIGNTYQATSTQYMGAATVAAWMSPIARVLESTVAVATSTPQGDMSMWTGTSTNQRFEPITLGSVVISSTTAHVITGVGFFGGFKIINASTTRTDILWHNSTTIARFDENVSPGTYTFDITLDKGLQISVESGYNGSAVITWR